MKAVIKFSPRKPKMGGSRMVPNVMKAGIEEELRKSKNTTSSNQPIHFAQELKNAMDMKGRKTAITHNSDGSVTCIVTGDRGIRNAVKGYKSILMKPLFMSAGVKVEARMEDEN